MAKNGGLIALLPPGISGERWMVDA
jgi:hypothetical protein